MSRPTRVLLLLLLLIVATHAGAHTFPIAYVDLQGEPARATVDLPLRDVAELVPLDADGDRAVTWGEARAAAPALATRLRELLQLRGTAGDCRLDGFDSALRRYADGSYLSLAFALQCAGAAMPAAIDATALLTQLPAHRVLVTWAGDDATGSTVLSLAQPQRALDREAGFVAYLREGVHHILIGYDHLAFLLSLLLPAALLRREARWQREQRLAPVLWRAIGVVSAFTLAHSITLSLAALGVVSPPMAPIEAAIAASVVAAALNNVWPIVTGRRWLLACGFGLLHGFGFAGALSELGLPRDGRLLALLGFNLGVEIGQVAVVVVLLPAIHALSRWRAYPRAVLAPLSLAIAVLGVVWLVERTVA